MQEKKISWFMLALMTFTPVWGFGNIANGFVYFRGTHVVIVWLVLFAVYFVPYALMVGELGSAFSNESGGLSSWINRTCETKIAYFAGWTYWACQVSYVASKSGSGLKSLSWAIFRNAETYDSIPSLYIQMVSLAVLLLSCFIASKGINPLKRLLSATGFCTLILSFLYIILIIAAPAIRPSAEFVKTRFSLRDFFPVLTKQHLSYFSILVFALGGCEMISPYINKVKNPRTDFPRGMITLTVMVSASAILGTVAMGKMFDPAVIESSTQSFNSYVANSSYWAFQKLGQYYSLGDFFLVIYAVCNAVSQFSVLVLCIDAPLRIMIDNEETKRFIPSFLHSTNKYGVHKNGVIMIAILCGSIIAIQSFVPGAPAIIAQMVKLNAICIPLRYLWVFVAYIRIQDMNLHTDYKFVKNRKLAKVCGIWCFTLTAGCSLAGMYDKDPFLFAMNVITPVVLVALGFIPPAIAKHEKRDL